MQKYRVLRSAGKAATVLGWVFSILGILWCVSGAVFMYRATHNAEHIFKAAASGVMIGIAGLMLVVIGGIAKVAIDIEKTSRTANDEPSVVPRD